MIILNLILLIINLVLTWPTIRLLKYFGFYKTNQTKGVDTSNRNPLYYKFYQDKLDSPTPGSFGILFIINLIYVLAVLYSSGLLDKNNLIVVFFALIFLLLGLGDDIVKYFLYLKLGHWGIKSLHKLCLQLVIATSFVLLMDPNTYWVVAIILTLTLTFGINAYNIIDGLDGLAGGIALIISILNAVMFYEKGTTDFYLLSLGIIIFCFVFLIFNRAPAKVFLGDTGSMAIGFLIVYLSYINLGPLSLVLLTLVFAQGLSSLVQIIGLKLFHKKIFPIAPLHLTLLNWGITKSNIVYGAWILQISLAVFVFFIS